jgi:hypothetical protein
MVIGKVDVVLIVYPPSKSREKITEDNYSASKRKPFFTMSNR